VVCPASELAAVVAAMRKAHSYEEPAYDVYPLKPAASSIVGEGRVGKLPAAATVEELARTLKGTLRAAAVQMVGEPGRQVERVAVACGAAGEFLGDAVRANADVFVTGEMRFHDYLSAKGQGIALILPGHYATERFAVEELAQRLQREFPGLEVKTSAREADPVRFV
jgi:putative NIF3 family GTP cyclohydrolase 1 type 2